MRHALIAARACQSWEVPNTTYFVLIEVDVLADKAAVERLLVVSILVLGVHLQEIDQ